MTEAVFQQIISIRAGGTLNMLDVNGVQRQAYEQEFYELVNYIEDDKPRYFHFIMTGQLPDGEENPAVTIGKEIDT